MKKEETRNTGRRSDKISLNIGSQVMSTDRISTTILFKLSMKRETRRGVTLRVHTLVLRLDACRPVYRRRPTILLAPCGLREQCTSPPVRDSHPYGHKRLVKREREPGREERGVVVIDGPREVLVVPWEKVARWVNTVVPLQGTTCRRDGGTVPDGKGETKKTAKVVHGPQPQPSRSRTDRQHDVVLRGSENQVVVCPLLRIYFGETPLRTCRVAYFPVIMSPRF